MKRGRKLVLKEHTHAGLEGTVLLCSEEWELEVRREQHENRPRLTAVPAV